MKKIISFFLAVCMVLMPVLTAFAENTAEDIQPEMATQREVSELHSYAWDTIPQLFYIGENYSNMIWLTIVSYDEENCAKLELLVEELAELPQYGNHSDEASAVTKEQVVEYYARIDAAARACRIMRGEMENLLTYCRDEKNLNGYYPADLWNDFVIARENAEAFLAENTDAEIASDTYWGLKAAFNALCAVNQVDGDIDFDGEADIIDATLIQRYCANMIDLNTSQKIVGIFTPTANQYKDDVDITDATKIQRYLAGMSNTLKAGYKFEYAKDAPIGVIGRDNRYYMTEREAGYWEWVHEIG